MKTLFFVFALTACFLVYCGVFTENFFQTSIRLSEQAEPQSSQDVPIRLILNNLFAFVQPGSQERIIQSGTAEPCLKKSEATLVSTDRDMDIAIIGEGFLIFQDDESCEMLYSRCGSLNLNPDGCFILCSDNIGRKLDPEITVPNNIQRIKINDDGGVWGLLVDQNRNVENRNSKPNDFKKIGQIELAVFPNPERLKPIDDIFFAETKASGSPICSMPGVDGRGVLQSQHLERSNIDADVPLDELQHPCVIQASL